MSVMLFNIQRYSLHDGGGIRTMIFFKGCFFTCPWCSNPESLSKIPEIIRHPNKCIHCSSDNVFICKQTPIQCPTNALEVIGKEWLEKDIIDEVMKDQIFYQTSNGGVTFSGGEPLLQYDSLLSLAKKLKDKNIHMAMETTLAIDNVDISMLLKYIDVFLVDFKIMDIFLAKQLLHLDIAVFKRNVEEVINKGGKVIARIPLIPKYIATNKNIYQIIEYIQSLKIEEVHLLPFHKLATSKYRGLQKEYAYEKEEVLSNERINEIVNMFKEKGHIVYIGGK